MSAKYKLPLAKLVQDAYEEGQWSADKMLGYIPCWENSEAKKALEKYLKGESQ